MALIEIGDEEEHFGPSDHVLDEWRSLQYAIPRGKNSGKLLQQLESLRAAIDKGPTESTKRIQREVESTLIKAIILGGYGPACRRAACRVITSLFRIGGTLSAATMASDLVASLQSGAAKQGDASTIGALSALSVLMVEAGSTIKASISSSLEMCVKFFWKAKGDTAVRAASLDLMRAGINACGDALDARQVSEAMRCVGRGMELTAENSIIRRNSVLVLRELMAISPPPRGKGMDKMIERAHSLSFRCLGDRDPSISSAASKGVSEAFVVAFEGAERNGSSEEHCVHKATSELSKAFECAASNAVRSSLVEAWLQFVSRLWRRGSLNENAFLAIANQVMGILSGVQVDDGESQAAVHLCACVIRIMRESVLCYLSEDGRVELLRSFLSNSGQQKGPSTPFTLSSVRTASDIILSIGELSEEIAEEAFCALKGLLNSRQGHVVFEAACCIRCVAIASPSRASLMLEGLLEDAKKFSNLITAYGLAISTLVASSDNLPLGLSSSATDRVKSFAFSMLHEKQRSGWQRRIAAGWAILSGFLAASSQRFRVVSLEDEFRYMGETLFDEREISGLSSEAVQRDLPPRIAAIEAMIAALQGAGSAKQLFPAICSCLRAALKVMKSLRGSKSASYALQSPIGSLFLLRFLELLEAALQHALDYPEFAEIVNEQAEQIASLTAHSFRNKTLTGNLHRLLLGALDEGDAVLQHLDSRWDAADDILLNFDGNYKSPIPLVWSNGPGSSVDEFEWRKDFPCSQSLEYAVYAMQVNVYAHLFKFRDPEGRMSMLRPLYDSIQELGEDLPQRLRNKSALAPSGGKHGLQRDEETTSLLNKLTNTLAAMIMTLKPICNMELTSKEKKRLMEMVQRLAELPLLTIHDRRAAAELISLVGCICGSAPTERLVEESVQRLENDHNRNPLTRSVRALSLGCIYRFAGGLALQGQLGRVVKVLVNEGSTIDEKAQGHMWAIHSLGIVALSMGPNFQKQIKVSTELCSAIIDSDDARSLLAVDVSVARLVNAMMSVVGPELKASSSWYDQLRAFIEETCPSETDNPPQLLERSTFQQQVAIFAPTLLPVHTMLPSLLRDLQAGDGAVRSTSMRTLHHLCEKEPKSIVSQRAENAIFWCLDMETFGETIVHARGAVHALLLFDAPRHPISWMKVLKTVALGTIADPSYAREEPGDSNTSGMNEADEEEKGVIGECQGQTSKAMSRSARFHTRKFAAECCVEVLNNLGHEQRKADMRAVKQDNDDETEFLLHHLQDAVDIAYRMATVGSDQIGCKGIESLCRLVQMFGSVEDPALKGRKLMEQYHAQLLSAIRYGIRRPHPTMFKHSSFLGVALIETGATSSDAGVTKRVLTHLLEPLNNSKSSATSNDHAHAEWIAIARVSYIAIANARVMTSKQSQPLSLESHEEHMNVLKPLWNALLQDCLAFKALSEETLFSYYLQVCRTGILLPEMNLSASSIPNSVAKDLADLQPYLLPAIAERGLDQGRTLTLVLKYFLADCAVKGFDSSEQAHMPLLRTAACVVKGSVFSEEELEALLEGCCEAFSEQLSHADSIAEAQWLISKACDSSLLSKDGALMAAALGLLTIAAANGAGEKDLAHSVFQYLSRLCSALAQHDTLANLVAAACIRYMGDMAEKLEDLSPISECLAASVPGCSYAVGRCVFREAVSIVKKAIQQQERELLKSVLPVIICCVESSHAIGADLEEVSSHLTTALSSPENSPAIFAGACEGLRSEINNGKSAGLHFFGASGSKLCKEAREILAKGDKVSQMQLQAAGEAIKLVYAVTNVVQGDEGKAISAMRPLVPLLVEAASPSRGNSLPVLKALVVKISNNIASTSQAAFKAVAAELSSSSKSRLQEAFS